LLTYPETDLGLWCVVFYFLFSSLNLCLSSLVVIKSLVNSIKKNYISDKSFLTWCNAKKRQINPAKSTVILLLLNQMLYILCLSYHYNTEDVLFACLSSGCVNNNG